MADEKSPDITQKELPGSNHLNQIILDSLPCVALLLRPSTREIVASNQAARKVGAIPGTKMLCYLGTAGKSLPLVSGSVSLGNRPATTSGSRGIRHHLGRALDTSRTRPVSCIMPSISLSASRWRMPWRKKRSADACCSSNLRTGSWSLIKTVRSTRPTNSLPLCSAILSRKSSSSTSGIGMRNGPASNCWKCSRASGRTAKDSRQSTGVRMVRFMTLK